MSSPAVRAAGLSKLFRHRLPRYRTVVGRLRRTLEGGPSHIPVWALRDVSFEVDRGECLAVTGPNGAGKSTLLRLIAGILEPTEGEVRVAGKTSTFFNLNAGQHGDLSLRDNVEIGGVLMGLSRREALARMDRILDFAELEDLAEVRMGELSSGQAARAAFATMVHSEPDILLIDDALSVGDRSFQEKCRRAIGELKKEGKTLIVVSHDDELLDAVATRRLRISEGREQVCG